MHRSPFIKKSVASLSQPFGLDPLSNSKLTHNRWLIHRQFISLSPRSSPDLRCLLPLGFAYLNPVFRRLRGRYATLWDPSQSDRLLFPSLSIAFRVSYTVWAKHDSHLLLLAVAGTLIAAPLSMLNTRFPPRFFLNHLHMFRVFFSCLNGNVRRQSWRL